MKCGFNQRFADHTGLEYFKSEFIVPRGVTLLTGDALTFSSAVKFSLLLMVSSRWVRKLCVTLISSAQINS